MAKDEKLPLVSVIVLCYNGKDFLERCLSALSKQTFKDFEIILVDNASRDGSVNFTRKLKIRLHLWNLRIIENTVNLGYCGGNNLGIRASYGKYVVILNQDTWVSPNWLEELVKTAELSYAGIFQSKILYPNGKIRTTGNFLDIYGMFACRGRFEEENGQYDHRPYDFFYASGASILLKREFFESIGGFDEDLFMYCEDVDLSWRARLKGYNVQLVPSSICFHMGGQFLSIDAKKFYFFCRNRIRVLLKNYSTKNIVKRSPLVLSLIVLSAFLLSFLKKDIGFVYKVVEGVLWNLKNLRRTINLRKLIQSSRKVNDEEIEKYMLPFSLELTHYRMHAV